MKTTRDLISFCYVPLSGFVSLVLLSSTKKIEINLDTNIQLSFMRKLQ